MRIVVMGAGSVGGYYGALLARAGHEVAFIARGRHLRALGGHGLEIQSPHGSFRLDAVATDDPSTLEPPDLLLLTVKTYHLVEAADQIRPLVGLHTAVLTLQNGVESPYLLAERLGRERVLPGVTWIESSLERPGLIVQRSRLRRIAFGEWDGARTERVERTEAALTGAGIEVVVPPDIETVIWQKFLFIVSAATLTSVCRQPIGPVRSDPQTRRLLEAVAREAMLVGRARGVAVTEEDVARVMELADGLEPDLRTSLQRDLEAGRPSEVDSLPGAVVRLGREVGVETPVSEVLYSVLALMDRRGRRDQEGRGAG